VKIKVTDLEPNPYRDIKNYPFDEQRIKDLMDAIDNSFFWPHLIGRRHKGKVQIAFGHHRIEAAKRLKIKEIEMTIMPLTDGQMIQYMAQENIGNNTDAQIVNSTVWAAKKYWDDLIAKYPKYEDILEAEICLQNIFTNAHAYKNVRREGGIGKYTLMKILPSWYTQYKIETALGVLKAIKSKTVSREALKTLKSQATQDIFRKEVAKGKPLDKKTQKSIARTIVKEDLGRRDIPARISEIRQNKKRRIEPKKKPFLDDYLKETIKIMHDVYVRIKRIKGNEGNVQDRFLLDNYLLEGKGLKKLLNDTFPEKEAKNGKSKKLESKNR